MLHINSKYVSGLLKPCLASSTPLSSIIVKTDDYFFLSRSFRSISYEHNSKKCFYIIGAKPLSQWVN